MQSLNQGQQGQNYSGQPIVTAPRSRKKFLICLGSAILLILTALIIIPFFTGDISKSAPAKKTQKPETIAPVSALSELSPAPSKPAISKAKEQAMIAFEAGMDYYKRNRNEDAITAFTKAIEGRPGDYKAYFYRGHVYLEQKEYDMAVLDLNRAIELKPNYVRSYIARGRVYDNKKTFDLSIIDYTKAISLDLKNADAYYYRGLARERNGDYDGAKKDYERTVELNPNYQSAIDRLEGLNKK